MQDVHRPSTSSQPLSLSQWLYQAICAGESETARGNLRLRLRLRGNHLHVLCESDREPTADRIVPRLIRALRSPEAAQFDLLAGKTEEPVYKVVLYGRVAGESRPAWIEPIDLEPLRSRPLAETANSGPAMPVTTAPSSLLTAPSRTATLAAAPPPARSSPTLSQPTASIEEQARGGESEAIARYLSESLAPLGVGVRVLVQKLPQTEADEPAEVDLKRLWVVCSCSYSPDASLIAQPLARQLRELQLEGFKEAAIRLQVSGEAAPDWVLQVDLTSPSTMLRDWARWGEVQALERLLDRVLRDRGVRVRATLKDGTLHLFCSLRSALGLPQEIPPQPSTTAAIAETLEQIAPQGIAAAAIYGVRSLELEAEVLAPAALKETPVWVQWLNLPAARDRERAPTTIDRARQLDLAALAFLLQRLLNPDLDERLTTGGIRIKLCIKESVLHVMTEALVCPPQVQVVSRIEKLLRHLELAQLQGARLYGRRAGQTAPLWSYTLDWSAAAAKPPLTVPASREPEPATVIAPSPTPPSPETEPEADAAAATPAEPAAAERLSLPQQVQRWLCQTRVFVPRPTAGDLARQPQTSLSRLAAERNLRVAAVWLGLGLALALQLDWLLGRTLRRAQLVPTAQPAVISSEGTDAERSLAVDRPTTDTDRFTAAPPDRRDSEAAAAAILASARSPNPSFNNDLLDEKLALYQERLRTGEPPEVLIVGSSRAMRGIDPMVLQQAIATQGYRNVEIFNFGINGATAQVVDLLLRRILNPEQLPELVIWADGARAFNSGRPDLTYEAIASSEGYQRLEAGTFPGQTRSEPARRPPLTERFAQGFRAGYSDFNRWFGKALGEFSAVHPQREQLYAWLQTRFLAPLPAVEPVTRTAAPADSDREPIDLDGFLAIATRFNPDTYYRQHARVSGAYDSDYDSFSLRGRQYQALRDTMNYLNQQDVEVVFVNLPLTDEYLDPVRQDYEDSFEAHMETAAQRYGLIFRDLVARWATEHAYFSDPSHLNRYGAYEVSQHLARDPAIPWEVSTE